MASKMKRMSDAFSKIDPANSLTSADNFAFFINEALATDDADYIVQAIGTVVRAKGITQVARQTGFSRSYLSRSFSFGGDPTLEATFAVMKSLGIKLTPTIEASSCKL